MRKREYEVDIIKLKKIMLDNDIGRGSELAKRTKISRNTIGKVLNGSIRPSSQVMDAIVSELNMSSQEVGEIFFKPILPNMQERGS